jgi:hypothetical protein
VFFTNLTLPQGLWWRFCPFLQEMRAEMSEKSPRFRKGQPCAEFQVKLIPSGMPYYEKDGKI